MPINSAIYEKYTKEQIDAAIELLTYRHITPLPKQMSDSKSVLYVFRHGQTTDNAEFIFSGWRDPDLTELGVQQADILAPKLKDIKFDMLYASDQRRSIKTMQHALYLNNSASTLQIVSDARIKERNYGELQGHSKLLVQLEDPELLALERRSYDFVPPNGESLAMVIIRVNNFLKELIPLMQGKKMNVAVSCHGNSIRGFRQHFEKLTNDQTAAIETPLAQDYASYVID